MKNKIIWGIVLITLAVCLLFYAKPYGIIDSKNNPKNNYTIREIVPNTKLAVLANNTSKVFANQDVCTCYKGAKMIFIREWENGQVVMCYDISGKKYPKLEYWTETIKTDSKGSYKETNYFPEKIVYNKTTEFFVKCNYMNEVVLVIEPELEEVEGMNCSFLYNTKSHNIADVMDELMRLKDNQKCDVANITIYDNKTGNHIVGIIAKKEKE